MSASLHWLRENAPDLIFPTYRTRKTTFFPYVYGRMSWDAPAPCLKGVFYEPASGPFTHPDGERTITIREGAKITSFPDDFVFLDGKGHVARQIANAVPPVFAQVIAQSVKDYMIDGNIL